MAAILNSSNQPITSGNIGSVIDVSGLVAYVGTAVEVVTPALCAIVISTSDFAGRHFEFCSWPTSGNVDSVIFNSGLVGNVVEIASLCPFVVIAASVF